MKLVIKIAIALTLLLSVATFAAAQSQWAPLTNGITILDQNGMPYQVPVGPVWQLRDGRVLVHEEQDNFPQNWFVLTPDAQGSYLNGTWTQVGSTDPSYGPFYFGSQLLLNGKQFVIEGGEYNNNCANGCWTNLGSIATIVPWGPITWALNSPPTGWTQIGDAESVLLADGRYMQANCCTAQNAIYNGPNSWTPTGSVNQRSNDESGFTLLPSGKVLTVDTKRAGSCGASKASELYDPTTGVWSCGPQTPVQLYNSRDEELGSAVLMYNNKVFQFGGNVVATALYDVAGNTWASGPTPPNGLDQADGPGALEPNGKVLEMLSPGLFGYPCQFMEYDPTGSSLSYTATQPDNCPPNGNSNNSDSSFYGHLMILPTGQIMFADFSPEMELYTPAAGVVAGVRPTILASSTVLRVASSNNILYGTQLNGLSENNAYGDDYQSATNFPLVRFTSVSNGNVYYAFTHDDSTHSIAPGTFMYTKFDLPPTMPAGIYNMEAVANGIPSSGIKVQVK